MKARKKPVEIEAFRTGSGISGNEAIDFCEGNAYISGLDHQLYIKTLEGEMKVSIGDYIIKGVQGEFYPCKPDIFDKTYDVIN